MHTLNPVPCVDAGAMLRPCRCWPASHSAPPALPGTDPDPGSISCSQSCPGTHTKQGVWRRGVREGSFPQLLFLQPLQGWALPRDSLL